MLADNLNHHDILNQCFIDLGMIQFSMIPLQLCVNGYNLYQIWPVSQKKKF